MRSVVIRHSAFSRNIVAALLILCVYAVGTSAPAEDETQSVQTEQSATRTLWTTSRIKGSPTPPPPYQVERVFPKLNFSNPVDIVVEPTSKRFYVAEMSGKIFSFDSTNDDVQQADLAIDLKKAHEDLSMILGIAFHPNFAENRKIFICWVGPGEKENGSVISSYTISKDDPATIDPASETPIITWLSGGHNGCCLKFGPDGFLYFCTGDASAPSPPDGLNTGQNLTDLLSCILRIDVDRKEADKNYAVPPDNPFVDVPDARPEIWAYGFRNPWRMSFDRDGRLWVGDVGWELWEMIYEIRRGGNYGWSVTEGPQAARLEAPRGPTPILPPVVAHAHLEARSITGGFVYYGERLKELTGAYVYGDFETGKVWALRYDNEKVTSHRQIAQTTIKIVGFGVSPDNELVVLDHAGGIFRLVKSPKTDVNTAFPTKLSETGLFASVKSHQPAPGVIPYQINASAWADHATSERFIALPGDVQLKAEERRPWSQLHQWQFPADSVLVKTLSLRMDASDPASTKRIETQILQFTGEGNNVCHAYTFAWNDQQTDAILVDMAGADRTFSITDPNSPSGIRQQKWHFSARNECLFCHNDTMGSTLGFNAPQLCGITATEGSESTSTELQRLFQLGIFDKPIELKEPPIVNPWDESAELEARAKSYLHVNCTHCHRFQGGGNASIELRNDFNHEQMKLFDLRPTQGTFGIDSAKMVASGDPYRSVLLYRLAKLGPGRMPRAGSHLVDQQGMHLIKDWIASLPVESERKKDVTEINFQELAGLATTQDLADAKILKNGNSLAGELLKTTRGALMLSLWLDELPADNRLRLTILEQAKTVTDLQIRDLFERFLPAEEQIARLGSIVDEASILQLAGDRQRGKQLYFENAGVQCKNCHRVKEQGQQVGPDLDAIGAKQTRAQILKSILEPSKDIDPKFMTYLAECSDGKTHTGILVSRDEKQTTLRQIDGKNITIDNTEIEVFAPQNKSLMPELLLKDLTPQDVVDLIDFIRSGD